MDQPANPPPAPQMVKCPQCASMVNVKRLEKHIERVHVLGFVKSRAAISRPSISRPSASRAGSAGSAGRMKCSVCGFPAIPGDNVCYTHSG